MALLSSYGSENFIMINDYNCRFNQMECGEPQITVEILSSAVSSSPTTRIASIDQWWRAVIEETASFKYVGMSYDAAQSCANTLRNSLMLYKSPWLYGEYISPSKVILYGWHTGSSTPVCESEVRLEKHGDSRMYDVVVNAKHTSENYSRNGSAQQLNNRPLYSIVSNLPGWNVDNPLSGHHFDSASVSNIVLEVAPTRTVNFELVGENIVTTSKTLTGLSVHMSSWYRATTDWYAQVKYEGMTKSACHNLYSSLNSTSGWYLSSHPWEYYYDGETLGWHPKETVTQRQCLNQFKATEDESGMFTVELTLHAQIVQMTTNPRTFTPDTYPSFWSSKIPGLSNYL